MIKIGLRREISERALFADSVTIDTMYHAITGKWPQINPLTRIEVVNHSSAYYIAEINEPVTAPPVTYPTYTRKEGKIAWLWRLWYDLMVRVGQEDEVLKLRGWKVVRQPYYSYPPSRHNITELEFTHFQVPYSDFFATQLEPLHMAAAYYPAKDILYLWKG